MLKSSPKYEMKMTRNTTPTPRGRIIIPNFFTNSAILQVTKCNNNNKANLRDLIAATGLVILLKLDSNRRFFALVTLKFDGWPRKIIRHIFYTTSSFNLCIISDPSGNSNWRYSPETANLGQNRRFFWPCDLRIWRTTLKNNRTPLLFYFKLCASFRSHWWIQTWASPETPNLGEIWWFLEPCDLEIWRMTLKNNRTPLLCYFKLCALFRSHQWFQTGDTVRKRPIWVKIDDF